MKLRTKREFLIEHSINELWVTSNNISITAVPKGGVDQKNV